MATARASVMDGALGGSGGGSAAPTRLRVAAQRNRSPPAGGQDRVETGLILKDRAAITESTITIQNYPPELLARLTKLAEGLETFAEDERARLEAQTEQLGTELGVQRSAVENFLRILGERNVPLEELPAKLAEIAERQKELLAQLGAFRTDDPEVQALRRQAADALEAGDYDLAEARLIEARQAVRTARERLQAALSEQALQEAQIEAELGGLELTRLDYRAAAEHFKAAAELVPASAPLVRAGHLNRFGRAAQDAGDYSAAGGAFEEALRLRQEALDPEHPDLAVSLNNLATLYQDTGRYGEAEPLFQRALAIVEKTLPTDHPHQALFRENYAGLLEALGRGDEATRLRARDAAARR